MTLAGVRTGSPRRPTLAVAAGPRVRRRRARRLRLRGRRRAACTSVRRSSCWTTRAERRRQREGHAAGDPRAPTVRLGAGRDADAAGRDLDLVVTSPGLAPVTPDLRAAARAADLPVWGEVELAWRLRDPEHAGAVAVRDRHERQDHDRADARARCCGPTGCAAVAAGNVGLPLCEVVMDPEPYDVVAVELSSHQLHWSRLAVGRRRRRCSTSHPTTCRGTATWRRYAAAKARIYHALPGRLRLQRRGPGDPRRWSRRPRSSRAAGRSASPWASRPSACSGSSTTCWPTGRSSRAATRNAAELGPRRRRADRRPAQRRQRAGRGRARPRLRRRAGVGPATGCRASASTGTGSSRSARVDGVAYVDDSKATNPHAALASLRAFDPVVWVAGGLAKGATFDELVAGGRDRLRAVVLLGADRAVIAEALARHAPDVPVIEVADTDTGVMERVVDAAASVARAGDTVLLAPACASQDLFADYAARGDAFAAAVAGSASADAEQPRVTRATVASTAASATPIGSRSLARRRRRRLAASPEAHPRQAADVLPPGPRRHRSAAVARPADGAERVERHVAARVRQLLRDLHRARRSGSASACRWRCVASRLPIAA